MKIYFDNAATTQIHPKVLEVILPYLKEDFGNPSSIHSYGRKIRVKIEEARETIADFINAEQSEIYFTSSGTEAINFAISGIAKTERSTSGKEKIITSKVEHQAVLQTCNDLSNQGFEILLLDADKESRVNLKQLERLSLRDTSLISLIHINNETGSVNNIEYLTKTTNQSNIHIFLDTIQSFGKVPLDVNKLGVNSIVASGHKIYGPKGIGMAYVKNGTPISPLIFGGSQERNRRGGTENVPGIIGFAEAVRIAEKEMGDNYKIVAELKNNFIAGLINLGEKGITINSRINSSPYILSITFQSEYYNNDAEAMLIFLDINGIAASNGAACTSGTLKPSHVMLNSGMSAENTAGTIRFSFSPKNTFEEVEYTLEILKKMGRKFRK